MPKHGTRSRYVSAGCRCAKCKLAESNYQRTRRRGIDPKTTPLAAVPALPVETTDPGDVVGPAPGRVEAAVIAEIGMLSTAAKRPGLAAGALAMARLIDNPLNTPQAAPAMSRLQQALAELRVGADVKRGWLAEVRQLVPPTSGTAG